MKHSRISLLERAAEAYDLGFPLRTPSPAAPEAPAEPASPPKPAPEAVLEAQAPATWEAAERIEAPTPTQEPALAREPVIAEPRPCLAPPKREQVPTQKQRDGERARVDRVLLEQMGYIVPEAPVSGLAEEFRLVKRQLLTQMELQTSLPEAKRRTILICSGHPGEGKSFCAVNLALSLAGEEGGEILLVDGDFTKPDLLSSLGLEEGPGLVDALVDSSLDPEDLVIRTDVGGLSVLPAGRREPNVPELLASERTRTLFDRLIDANSRRIILFDSPPALMASTASLLASFAGQTLVVVRADVTTESDLRDTVQLLTASPHVALVLNGASMTVSGRKYGAYEGYAHAD